MKPLHLCCITALCFGAGWWLDSLWTPANDHPDAGLLTKIPVVEEVPSGEPAGTTVAASTTKPSSALPASLTINEILAALAVESDVSFDDRLARALEKATPADLSRLAEELTRRLRKIDDDHYRLECIAAAVVKKWLPLEPNKALELGIPLNSGDAELRSLMHPAIQKLFQTDLAEATRLLNHPSISFDSYMDARLRWIRSFAGMEAAKALKMIVEFDLKTKNDVMRANYFGEFSGIWVRQDGPAAMNWALKLPPSYDRRYLLGRMAREWAAFDAPAARDFVNSVPQNLLPRGNLRDSLVKTVGKGKS